MSGRLHHRHAVLIGAGGVIEAAVSLAHDEAACITAQALAVDGGSVMR